MSERPEYLKPYDAAAARYGAGFGALLWASPATQAARFEAICRLVDFHGKSVLDVGCGRGDFLDYLIGRKVKVARYVGLEGVPALADAARAKGLPDCEIVETDFVAQPQRLRAGAQVVVLSGSLNTMDSSAFYSTLRRAFEAAGEMMVFNFLCSPKLAAAEHLRWHPMQEVSAFAQTLSQRVRTLEDYLPGDFTIAMGKSRQ